MRYFVAIAGLILIAVVVIGVLVSYIPGGQPAQEGRQAVEVTDHIDSGSTYSLHITGRITAAENHHEVVIRISQTSRVIEVTEGYDGQLINSQRYSNSPAAFDEFVRALGGAGFTLEREVSLEEPRGVCPEGRRYNYRLMTNGETIIDTWSTSCKRSEGNFGGDDTLTQRLFERQIPDYNDFLRGIRL